MHFSVVELKLSPPQVNDAQKEHHAEVCVGGVIALGLLDSI